MSHEIFHVKKSDSITINRGWFRIFKFNMSVDEKVVTHCNIWELHSCVGVPGATLELRLILMKSYHRLVLVGQLTGGFYMRPKK